MKANKIILESDYNKGLAPDTSITFQNTKNYYCTLGAYGASITSLSRTGIKGYKHVNAWREYSYKQLCDKFDNLEFESF